MALKEEAESEWQSVCGKLFQMDQHKKNNLSPNIFVFTQGVKNVYVLDVDCNCFAGQ